MINKSKFSLRVLLCVCLAFASLAVNAQTTLTFGKAQIPGITVQNLKLDSKLMRRSMPYRVILPKNYDADKTVRYPVVYLLHGLTGHFDNWDERTKLKDYALGYNYIFVMAEGNNGWYTDSAIAPNDKYESYIIKELIPAIDENYRTLADRNHRAVAGLSMGGYGAIKFGLKYPELFTLVGSFSGALPAATWSAAGFAKIGLKGDIPDSIAAVYGADDSPTRANNDIYKMAKEISAEKIKSLPFVYQSCGTEDFLIKDNHDFAEILFEKKIPHEYREHPGIHDWKFWDDQIKEFLETSEAYLR